MELIHAIVKLAVQGQDVTPVFMGIGLQEQGRAAAAGRRRALFAVAAGAADERPRPTTIPTEEFPLEPDPAKPFVGMAFKIVDDPYGQLTFMRIYQGTINKGEMYFNQRTGQKQRFSRIVKMHADKRAEIDSADAGDIVAIMGIDCASGDTYASQNEILHAGKHVHRRAGHQDGDQSGQPRRRRSLEQGLGPLHAAKIRRSASRPTKKPARRSSPAWASCTWKFTSSGFAANTRSKSKSARRRSATARRPTAKAEYNYQAQEADRRFGPVCPYRRLLRTAARGLGRDLRVRETRSSAAAFRGNTFRRWKRASAIRWPRARSPAIPIVGVKARAGRRLVPRRRQLGHGVPDLRPQLLPRNVPEDQAGAAGADHEGRSRSADATTKARWPAN